MLVLSRKVSQQILIGSDIRITVVKVERNQVRIGIDAPDHVTILRGELLDDVAMPSLDHEPAADTHEEITV
jgi:carbon storage regulator